MPKRSNTSKKECTKLRKQAQANAASTTVNKRTRSVQSTGKNKSKKRRKSTKNTQKQVVLTGHADDGIDTDEYDSETDGEDCLRQPGDTARPTKMDYVAAVEGNEEPEEIDQVYPGDQFTDSSDDESDEPFVVATIMKRRGDGAKNSQSTRLPTSL